MGLEKMKRMNRNRTRFSSIFLILILPVILILFSLSTLFTRTTGVYGDPTNFHPSS